MLCVGRGLLTLPSFVSAKHVCYYRLGVPAGKAPAATLPSVPAGRAPAAPAKTQEELELEALQAEMAL
jgi:hypothetical protein